MALKRTGKIEKKQAQGIHNPMPPKAFADKASRRMAWLKHLGYARKDLGRLDSSHSFPWWT
jgi:hypothetical protein